MTDIIILFCTSLLGFLIGGLFENSRQRKEKLYLDLLNFTTSFRSNAVTSRVVFDEFIGQFCKTASKDFVLYSQQILQGDSTKFKLLNRKEIEYLKRFFTGLDAKNSQLLLGHLSFFENYFSDALTQVRAENNSKGKLAQKLGLLCGVIVGLVLI